MKQFSIFLLAATALLILYVSHSQNLTASEKEDLKIEFEEQQRALEGQLGAVSAAFRNTSLEVNKITNYEIPKIQLEYNESVRRASEAQETAAALTGQIGTLESKLAEVQAGAETAQENADSQLDAIKQNARDAVTPNKEISFFTKLFSSESSGSSTSEFVTELSLSYQITSTVSRLRENSLLGLYGLESKSERMGAISHELARLKAEAVSVQHQMKILAEAKELQKAEITNKLAALQIKQNELDQLRGDYNNRIHNTAAEVARLDREINDELMEYCLVNGCVPGSPFDRGFIISDRKLYTHDTMSVAQIQDFLNKKGASCWRNCLKDYRVTTTGTWKGWNDAHTLNGECTAFTVPDGTSLSAAEAISLASRLCNISEKALIVMLQKEQGLITNPDPSDWRYASALGFACPDTAACNATNGGLWKQLENAGWQFNAYKNSPYAYRYHIGNNFASFNPNAACGGMTIDIKNAATVGLYNYTPYTPNDAALAAGAGLGDGCSSYGNRNFYNYYNMWFGSTY
jgi:uncharacterized protein YlxW (UPF0749 family)